MCHIYVRRCSENFLAYQWKNEFIISKLFLITIDIISFKTNTFIILQRHYFVSVVVCTNLGGKKSCGYCCHLWSRPRTFQTTHVNNVLKIDIIFIWYCTR
jgi:hypothetical protein